MKLCGHNITEWYDVRTVEVVLQHEGQSETRFCVEELESWEFGFRSLPSAVGPQLFRKLGCPDYQDFK